MSAAEDTQVAAPPQVWPLTIKLATPVDFGSETITELVFQRGKMGHLKGLSLDGIPPIDQLLTLASRMCGRVPKVLEMLDAEDGSKVLEVALDFFAKCLGAGKQA